MIALGCSTSNPRSTPASMEFSWFHPQGGEFLFAYDKSECESFVVDQNKSLGVDQNGPFFTCMRLRGYSLVDVSGTVLIPPLEGIATGQIGSD